MQIGPSLSAGLQAIRANKTSADQRVDEKAPSASQPSASPVDASVEPSSASKTFAETAKEKLMADYKKAEADGTYIVDDIAGGGRLLDASKLNDEELAAVVNEKGFSEREVMAAKVEFGVRVKATLAPFTTPRDSALAVKAIYPTLSPAVRKALGWSESMLDMGERIIKDQGGPLRPQERESFFMKLNRASNIKGGLKFDISAIHREGGSVDRVA